MKKRFAASCGIALIGFALIVALAACDISAPIAGASGEAKGVLAANNARNRIVGTAALGTKETGYSAIYFDFDLSGTKKFARAFLPVSQDGFLKNGTISYEQKQYQITTLNIDPSNGDIYGETCEVGGVSYIFGLKYQSDMYFGRIYKKMRGIAVPLDGLFGGVPIAAGKNVANYIGVAKYNFPSSHSLIFNSVIDLDTQQTYGTWAETGWQDPESGAYFSIHGGILGQVNGQDVNINGFVFDAFKPYMEYDMSAKGTGLFKNPGQKSINGEFDIYYGPLTLNSTLYAVRVEK